MVEMADSKMMSLMPALSAAPIGWYGQTEGQSAGHSFEAESRLARLYRQSSQEPKRVLKASHILVFKGQRQRPAHNGELCNISPAAFVQRQGFIQLLARIGDHFRTALWIVAARLWGGAHGIGAVQRIIQGAPARIGGVEGVTGVHDRDNKLRACNLGDFRINVAGIDLKAVALRQKVAQLLEEGPIGFQIDGAGVGFVPCINLCLDIFTNLEQFAVLGVRSRIT